MTSLPKERPVEISGLIRTRVASRHLRLLEQAGKLAAARGWKAYAVGGMVRDVLLGLNNFDLDILVEEHGLEFARLWAEQSGGAFKLYRRFATAMVVISGVKIDVTTTRSERYPLPGSLPEVVPGSLEEDIFRRDFTINALAFSLNPTRFGRLIDLCGGWDDLQAGLIRVLHPRSFRDDPTRIFRAVRFQQRFGFRVESRTEELIRTAVSEEMFSRVSSERLRRELELIFKEPAPVRAIELMAGYDQLRFIHPSLSRLGMNARPVERLEKEIAWFSGLFPDEKVASWRLFLVVLSWELADFEFAEVTRTFNLSERLVRSALAARAREGEIRARAFDPSSPRSALAEVLDGLLPEVILILASRVEQENLRDSLRRYLAEDRLVLPALRGRDLIELGVAPGPEIGRIERLLRAARLDGEVGNLAQEQALVLKLVDRDCRA